MPFCVVDCGKQTHCTGGAQMPLGGGSSYDHSDDIFPPPAEDIIDYIGANSDDDGVTSLPHPR
jgi:hypothetical protein